MLANNHDPRSKYASDALRPQRQEIPGSEKQLNPIADHGQISYIGSGKLIGRVAIITGGDSGIGRAVAIAFSREGADIIISYLNEHEDAEETADLVRKAGRKVILIPGDICEEVHCAHIINKSIAEFGKIDILVNNAAFQKSRESLQDVSSDEWDKTFKTNIYPMFYLCKLAEKHLKPGASIINTTSVNAYKPKPTLIAYAATKGAIQNFTANLAQLWAENGVRVNCVAPGPIWTPLIPSTMSDEEVKAFGQNVPMKRYGQPAELAFAYVLLASDDSSYMTGSTIQVTGGSATI